MIDLSECLGYLAGDCTEVHPSRLGSYIGHGWVWYPHADLYESRSLDFFF